MLFIEKLISRTAQVKLKQKRINLKQKRRGRDGGGGRQNKTNRTALKKNVRRECKQLVFVFQFKRQKKKIKQVLKGLLKIIRESEKER